MMKQNNIILFGVPAVRDNLLPLSYTRPVADFLVGITTLRKKWEAFIDGVFSYFTPAYLSEKFPMVEAEENIFIASHVIATRSMAEKVLALVGDTRSGERVLIAMKGRLEDLQRVIGICPEGELFADKIDVVKNVYDIFLLNGRQIEYDFEVLTAGREGQVIPRSNTVIGADFYRERCHCGGGCAQCLARPYLC